MLQHIFPLQAYVLIDISKLHCISWESKYCTVVSIVRTQASASCSGQDFESLAFSKAPPVVFIRNSQSWYCP